MANGRSYCAGGSAWLWIGASSGIGEAPGEGSAGAVCDWGAP